MEGSSCSSVPALFLYCAQTDGVLQYHDNTHFLVCLPYLFLHSDYTVGVFFVCCFTTPHNLPRIFFLWGVVLLLLKSIFFLVIKKFKLVVKNMKKVHKRTKKEMKESWYCFEEQY